MACFGPCIVVTANAPVVDTARHTGMRWVICTCRRALGGDPALATRSPPHPPTWALYMPFATHPPTWALYMPFAYLACGHSSLTGPVSFSIKVRLKSYSSDVLVRPQAKFAQNRGLLNRPPKKSHGHINYIKKLFARSPYVDLNFFKEFWSNPSFCRTF